MNYINTTDKNLNPIEPTKWSTYYKLADTQCCDYNYTWALNSSDFYFAPQNKSKTHGFGHF